MIGKQLHKWRTGDTDVATFVGGARCLRDQSLYAMVQCLQVILDLLENDEKGRSKFVEIWCPLLRAT